MMKKGFTLVEILIVVVILGILAAIVIPQFSDASTEAKENSLKSNLQTVRSQIELYKIQHNDELPGAGSASFTDSLTAGTDVDGASGSDYGPYLQSFPTNPFNDLATVDIDGTAGDNSHGWYFDSTSGDFSADDSNDHAAW
jgi:general secretion pathway protein G